MHPTGITVRGLSLYYLPVQTRLPLKFGSEILTEVVVARAQMMVSDSKGKLHEGWGETPLSVQWAWPAPLPLQERLVAMQKFCERLSHEWVQYQEHGDALELGWLFQQERLRSIWQDFNQQERNQKPPMPWLAALICLSLFDIALHDAYGKANQLPSWDCYGPDHLAHPLSRYLKPAATPQGLCFDQLHPAQFMTDSVPKQLEAWHLVGGLDPLNEDELTGNEPQDHYPVLLADWIERDGLRCLKIKLRGNDARWDYDRCVAVGQIALQHGARWLTADFNCTVTDPDYVNQILDQLRDDHPRIYGMLLYVEQPFPYELADHPIDVHSVASRKPLFLDESAHDWQWVARGRELGWTGVALKTCKTQTGAILSACWAKAHGMGIMVQDLTNPMLAQIPHVLLASRVGTIMGVETNAMQFYPEASQYEALIHPGLYQRREGQVDLTSVAGSGFGYRLDEIERPLPKPALAFLP
ncbi:MAG: enolase C-terminal domain-like protein [Verrucomicrobiota bacterium]